MFEYKIHEARIMGIYYDSITQYTYTVSEDKSLKVVDRGLVKHGMYFFNKIKI